MEGEGYPMVGSHDPRMIAIAQELRPQAPAASPTSTSSRCCTASGATSSCGSPPRATACASTSPYGTDWYGYFMRRLAERPANLRFFLRSLVSKG